MKRLLCCVLALCMALSLCVPALASDASDVKTADPTYASLSLKDADWVWDEANAAWCLEGVTYCLNPVSDLERMNIYVPGAYMDENGELTTAVVNGYYAETAPIIYLIDMGGYAEASPVGISKAKEYLAAGYVVASPGARGRETTDEDGAYIGKSPASIVDLKAGVRFLKYNDAVLAGDTDKIVTIGTSAGGAMSALLGCSGNNPAYDEYLAEIGAVMSSTDDVYACQCYCAAADMENMDAAYEWYYASAATYSGSFGSGELTEFQQALSADLADAYSAYINALGLQDEDGNALTLDGYSGSYYDYLLAQLGKSLSDYINETCSVVVSGMSPYTYIDEDAAQAIVDELNADEKWVDLSFTYATATTGPSTVVTYADGVVCAISSLEAFTEACMGRGKTCPSTDALDLSEPGNLIFGTETENALHFSSLVAELLARNDYSALLGYDADAVAAYAEAMQQQDVVALLNPMAAIADSDVAQFFRLCTGTADEHIIPTVSMNLTLALETYSDATVDFAMAWDQPHGEAELNADDLMQWLERVCKFEAENTEEEIATLLDLSNLTDAIWTLSGSGDAAVYVLSPVVDVANPELADYQGVSVAIPAYYVKAVNADGSLEFDYDYEFVNPNGVTYTAATAPIIINTGAAGYSAGTTSRAGASYVSYGYINVACGNRGKSLSCVGADGKSYFCGDAPYCLVDQKACVRWLKYNIALGNLCGDADRMVSTGGSGGGAHSLMLAATGNNPDFYPYLEESGAIMSYDGVAISDGIWGCCPYSPITNLEEANMAYELESALASGGSLAERYSEFRQILSQGEAEQYIQYINAKGLTWDLDGDGVREALTIEYDEATDTWSGTFIELLTTFMQEQLAWYLNNIDESEKDWVFSYEGETYAEAYLKGDYTSSSSGKDSGMPDADAAMADAKMTDDGYASEADETAATGTGEDLTSWVSYTVDEDGQYHVQFSIGDFINYRGRGKTNPAFDDLDLGQAENQEFGDFDQDFKHWDEYALAAMTEYYDELAAAWDGTDSSAESFEALYAAYEADVTSMLAGDKFGQNIVYLYNPANYILDAGTDLPAWVHIVHGTADTDTSVLIAMVDAIEFDMAGVETFVAWSWDDPHVAGDPVGTTMQGFIDGMILAGY